MKFDMVGNFSNHKSDAVDLDISTYRFIKFHFSNWLIKRYFIDFASLFICWVILKGMPDSRIEFEKKNELHSAVAFKFTLKWLELMFVDDSMYENVKSKMSIRIC